MKTINASQLKAMYIAKCTEAGKEANWFSRGNMKFSGDTMANFYITKHENAFNWFDKTHENVYGVNRKVKTSEGFAAGHVSYFTEDGQPISCIAIEGDEKYITITRREYMENSSTLHHEYFAQFVTPYVKQRVQDSVSIHKLAEDYANGDKHLNETYSCSKVWDRVMCVTPQGIAARLKLAGENNSISTQVCIVKAAARILIEELNNETV